MWQFYTVGCRKQVLSVKNVVKITLEWRCGHLSKTVPEAKTMDKLLTEKN